MKKFILITALALSSLYAKTENTNTVAAQKDHRITAGLKALGGVYSVLLVGGVNLWFGAMAVKLAIDSVSAPADPAKRIHWAQGYVLQDKELFPESTANLNVMRFIYHGIPSAACFYSTKKFYDAFTSKCINYTAKKASYALNGN